jgi:hypothetical protein
LSGLWRWKLLLQADTNASLRFSLVVYMRTRSMADWKVLYRWVQMVFVIFEQLMIMRSLTHTFVMNLKWFVD